jgi:hypothetical protein
MTLILLGATTIDQIFIADESIDIYSKTRLNRTYFWTIFVAGIDRCTFMQVKLKKYFLHWDFI